MKNCIHCGKELAGEARWCPYCEKPQKEPERVKTPLRIRRLVLTCLAILVVAGTAAYAVSRQNQPKVYEGGASVEYRIDGKDCKILLSFKSNGRTTGEEQDQTEDRQPENSQTAVPSQLVAYSKEDPDIQNTFTELIDTCVVTAQPEEGAKPMEVNGPQPGKGSNFDAAWYADVVYGPENGTNVICWEVRMKNKDTIRLYQKVTCNLLETIEYHYEDTPMDTVEEIEALLKKTAEESPEAVLSLYLPPVTYEGSLVMDERTATLFGSEEDGKKTTFTDTLTVNTRKPATAELYELEFEGSGGTGLVSTDALYVQACVFTGWDIGVDAQNGSWISLTNDAFIGNGIGFRFDSGSATFSNPTYENVVFAENTLGMQILQVPGDNTLRFVNPIFDANETDYEDPKGLVKIE